MLLPSRFSFPLCALLLLASSAWASEPDLDREQRMADEIVDVIWDGEAIELEADGQSFLAIYLEAEEPLGTVVLAHGRGFHPDWETVINPLRVGLAEAGWNTLSIQMPVLEKSAKYFDYVEIFDSAGPRLEAAINFAKTQEARKTVLLAHSCGSHMAQRWIKNNPSTALASFDAYVGIGMGATDYKQAMVEPFQLDKMPMPVLDLYGADDYPAVLRMAPERLEMLRAAGNPVSEQVVVAGADHYFKGKNQALVEAVETWLTKLD